MEPLPRHRNDKVWKKNLPRFGHAQFMAYLRCWPQVPRQVCSLRSQLQAGWPSQLGPPRVQALCLNARASVLCISWSHGDITGANQLRVGFTRCCSFLHCSLWITLFILERLTINGPESWARILSFSDSFWEKEWIPCICMAFHAVLVRFFFYFLHKDFIEKQCSGSARIRNYLVSRIWIRNY